MWDMITIAFCTLLSTVGIPACDYSQDGPTSMTLATGQTGTVWYESNDGYDLTAYGPDKKLVVEGNLVLPKNHDGSMVIFSHGSGGYGQVQEFWAGFLHEKGIGTFAIDHFAPRGVINDLHSQVRVSEQQMAFDVLHAAQLLLTHPAIDSKRIFHAGWSKGAIAGMIASMDKVQGLNGIHPSDSPFAGFIEFYPWCGFQTDLKPTSPMLVLHGEEDNYTPLAMCRRLIGELQANGAEIRLETFAGAHHAFDKWAAPVQDEPDHLTIRRTTADCTLNVDGKSLEIRTVDGQFSIDNFNTRKAFLLNCAEKGVTMGGAPTHRERAQKLVLDFIANPR